MEPCDKTCFKIDNGNDDDGMYNALPCGARHYSKCFSDNNSFNPHNYDVGIAVSPCCMDEEMEAYRG